MLAPALLLLLALGAAAEATAGSSHLAVSLDVDWRSFLGSHDLVWDWQWRHAHVLALSSLSADLQRCNGSRRGTDSACCVGATGTGGSRISTVGCNASDSDQYWTFASNGSIMQRGLCLSLQPAAPPLPPQAHQQNPLPPPTMRHPHFPGYVQLAEASGGGCNKDPRGSAAGQCCLPVPGAEISGCHHPDVSRH